MKWKKGENIMKSNSIISIGSNKMITWNKIEESAKSFEYIEYDENHNEINSYSYTEEECAKKKYMMMKVASYIH